MRKCSQCKLPWPNEMYGVDKHSADGLTNACKGCAFVGRSIRASTKRNKQLPVHTRRLEVNKHCRICGESKAVREFGHNKLTADGRTSECRACTSDKVRKHIKDNPGKRAIAQRKYNEKTYGLQEGSYMELNNSQGGCCAICGLTTGNDKRLSIDHCT